MAIKIEKMPNGTYAVRVWAKFCDVFGKRRTKYKSNFKSVTSAKRWGEETEDLISEDGYDTKLNFKTLNDLYQEAKKNKISPTTIDKQQHLVKRCVEYLGPVSIKNINTRVVQQFIDYLSTLPNKFFPKQNLSKGTLQKYYKYIQSVLNWAVSQDYLEYNRVKKVEFPEDNSSFEPTILSAEKLGEILAFLKTHFYNIYIPVLLSCTTRARRGEFLGLKWDAIDFENSLILIKNNRIQTKEGIFDKNKLKTARSRRVLSMSDFLRRELLEHKELCQGLNSENVCANPFDGEVPTSPNYISRTFHNVILKQFGIKMRTHDLRHCFNQLAYEENVDETTRIKIMGHSNTKININTYTHPSLKKDREAMELISNEIEKSFVYNCE